MLYITEAKILTKLKFCGNYYILSKLSIMWMSYILIFIDLLTYPVPCNTSEKQEQNSKKITWSFDNFVQLFHFWLNFIVFTTWMISMFSEWLEFKIVLIRFPVSFEKREIRFVFQLFQKVQKQWNLICHLIFFQAFRQNVLGGLPISFENIK